MLNRDRQRRVLVLEALERRAKQFRSHEGTWPFRLPHEPLDLEAIVGEALAGEGGGGGVATRVLRTRSVLRMTWESGAEWELWAIALPSGVHLYCDADSHETRLLASAKRGNPSDADGFFLERLAESHGHLFGIEMAGPPPDAVRAAIGDRAFLADVFVELFEGTSAEAAVRAGTRAADFREVVVDWLERVLTAPPMTRRQPRVHTEDPSSR
jgi:hypothetical protein